MKSDHEIKTDVEAELRWTPDVERCENEINIGR